MDGQQQRQGEHENAPLLGGGGGNKRSPRVRPDREELFLLSIQSGDTPNPDQPVLAKTDAEMRIFLENEMIFQVKKDFSNVRIPDELLRELAKKTINHFQLELDLNIERFNTSDRPLNPEILADRISLLAFRYDRFLRSLKENEDREYNDRKRDEREKEVTLNAVSRVISGELPDGTKLPVNLVEHMLQVGMEQHLLAVRKFILGDEEAIGVTVTFKDLTVTRKIPNVQIKDSASEDTPKKLSRLESILRPRGPQTVWSATANTLFGSCFAIADRMSVKGPRTKEIQILKNLNGVVRPGRITLLLGAPHAGKTQLLHALSGQTKTTGPIKVSGNIYFNGYSSKQLHTPNVCIMVEQIDAHIPVLTVRETLQFAFKCRMRNLDKTMSPEMKSKIDRILKSRVEMVMATLGLTRVADTIIGNESIKGISGGEMRRVTLGEMMVIGGKVYLLDEISTGLDSAATFDITKSIRSLCRVFNNNTIVSLLQPPPETVDLFDDVILMSAGAIIYHGPREALIERFTAIGLPPDPTMDLADFLIDASLLHRNKLLDAYLTSDTYAADKAILDADPSTLQMRTKAPENKIFVEYEDRMINGAKYTASFRQMFMAVVQRQWKVMIRNKAFIMARLAQNLIMGLLLGALFFQIPFTQYYLVAMILQQLLSMSGFSTMALVGQVVLSRNIFYKQNKQNFFPASVYVIADYIVGLPFSLMDALLLGSIAYFMCGLSLSDNGRPYFIFLIIFVSFGVCMATLIRFFGYIARDQNVAFATAVFFNVFGLIFSGAVATPGIIPPYFIWIYWGFSPMAWAYRSALQNEYYSSKYEEQCESGCPNNLQGQCVQYCGDPAGCPTPYPQVSCGVYFLQARQVATDRYFLWLGIGMLWIFTLVAVGLSIFSLIYVRWDSQALTPVQADADAEFRDVLEKASARANKANKDGDETEEEEAEEQITVDGEPKPGAEVDIESQQKIPKHKKSVQLADAHKFTPKPLIWRDIVYSIELVPKDAKGRKSRHMEQIDLLKHVSGYAKPYTMTALMGSSGAGKTTLLDCLCFRKTVGKITGAVCLGKNQVVPKQFKKEVGYVEQFGVHSEKATVRESLEFSARLRLGKDYTDKERKQMIEDTIEILELRPIADQIVGRLGDPDGLSFEENKRVTIAVELVSAPSVLFADEPTSGLTSKEARLTMKALRRVAESGRPVICTIHQPSAAIFQLFHRLLLLKRGGEVVFFGDLGPKSANLVRYFESIPGVRPLPNGLNPATWMLEVIGAGVGRADNSAGMDFAEIYRSSDLYQENERAIQYMLHRSPQSLLNLGAVDVDDLLSKNSEAHVFDDDRQQLITEPQEEEQEGEGNADGNDTPVANRKVPMYRRSYWEQFRALSKRNFVEYWRTPNYSLLRWIIMLIFSLVAGLTFLQQQMGDAAGVQSRVGVINLLLLLTANYNSATIVPFAFSRKALFYREKASSMYASFLYAITLQVVEAPYILVEVFLSVVVFYFLVGMAPTAAAFFYYVFLMYFFVSFATYMGLMWAAALGSQGAASLVASLVTQLMVLFSGVALPGNVMPSWLLGFYYISPVRWAIEGLLASQFREYRQVICNTTGQLFTWENGTQPASGCPVNNGAVVSFYLPDVNLNACCNPLPNRPISAKAYVFTGFTYPDGVVTPPWLGGTNGYHIDWLGWDYLYVILIGLLIRIIAVILTQFVSHQLR